MKTAFAILTLALLALTQSAARAQSNPVHPADPTAVYIGKFTVTLTMTCPGAAKTGAGTQTNNNNNNTTGVSQGSAEILVFLLSSGQKDYVVDENTIHFTGDCDGFAAMPTGQLFGMFSQAAVAKAVSLGYEQCTANCNAPSPRAIRVYQALCVERLGAGLGTIFASCDRTAYCQKEYTVCCPDGPNAPVITQIGSTYSGVCGLSGSGSQCESTCQ